MVFRLMDSGVSPAFSLRDIRDARVVAHDAEFDVLAVTAMHQESVVAGQALILADHLAPRRGFGAVDRRSRRLCWRRDRGPRLP